MQVLSEEAPDTNEYLPILHNAPVSEACAGESG